MEKCLIRFGPMEMDFQSVTPENDHHPMWQWKLDPFLMDETVTNAYALPKPIFPEIKDIITVSRTPEGYRRNCSFELVESRAQGFYDRKIYRTVKEYIFEYVRRASDRVLISASCSKDGKNIRINEDNSQTDGEMAFEYLTHVIPYAFLMQQVLIFHGALMEYRGKGLIISAPSGTGKTTHARFWRDYKNALIINGDRAACYRKDNIWTGFGMPWSGSSGEQVNREVPIAAIVILEQGSENHAEKLSIAGGFRTAFSNLLSPSWDIDTADLSIPLFSEFIEEIPVIRLSARPDFSSVDSLYEILKQNKYI